MNIQLPFSKIQGNTPGFACHWCGLNHSGAGWQIADMKPFENEAATVSIVVCSDECKNKVLELPVIEYALANMILNVAKLSHEKLKVEYADWIAKLLMAVNRN